MYVRADAPPWRSWTTKSRAARCMRWIETFVRVPSGEGAGEPLKLAEFQQDLIEEFLAEGARSGGLQIGAGNAKSTLAAAIGLWALADPPDAPQVPLVAYNGLQANRTLFTPMRTMIRSNPILDCLQGGWLQVRAGSNERGIGSAWNNGELWPLPADDERLQGLNFTVALVDEAEYVELAVLQSLEDRQGKRPESLLLVLGTPGPDRESVLFHVRTMHHAGAHYRWVEHAAPADCHYGDPDAWRAANPALGAGFLSYDVFEDAVRAIALAPEHKRPVLERRFRLFRLGQWIDVPTEEGWLPDGAWESCRVVEAPSDGERIVVAVDGTYRRTTAVVGATLDGADVFLLWAAELATDEEIEAVVREAVGRWDVAEVVHYPSIRSDLMKALNLDGLPVVAWDRSRAVEVEATNALWQAITDGTFRHDGHELLAKHFGAVTAKEGPEGITLRRLSEGQWIDAALAARIAWWRAKEMSALVPAIW